MERNGVTWLLAGMCNLIDKRMCNSLCQTYIVENARKNTGYRIL